nr:hypothetical protein [Tanacetum cinerariifolium]
METYKNVLQDIHNQLNAEAEAVQIIAEAEAVQIILTGIDNDIYSTVDACPNAYIHNQLNAEAEAVQIIAEAEAKAIERLKQGESINDQDLETNLYWEFGKTTSQDGESLESYYSGFYKMMNELIRNQCDVTNHQVNVQFLLQLQQEWQRNRGKAIVKSPPYIYDQEPSMVAEDDEMLMEKEIDKLMALISPLFKKVYKPTNNNLRTSLNTSRANQDNSSRIKKALGMTIKAYHREKMLLCKLEEAEIQLITEQADWRDDIDDESEDQELEAHYMYMTQIQEVSSDAADSGPIFDAEPLQKNDDDNDLANERELLASLIEKLKCEIDDGKNRNKFLETSNKVLVEKLKGEIEDFKNQNKSIESSNNRFKEANNKLSETNVLMYKDFKSQAELARRNDVKYTSKVEINCAKAKGDLISYKMESQKSFNKYTQMINDLNQTIFEMKKKLFVHQETISILSQQKEAQIKLYKTREDKELDKVITLENKVKVLDNIVYKTGQSVQTMNMLNSKCRTRFAKPEFLNKAQRVNPRLYDIGCYNDNLALMLAPESDDVIRLEKESRSKLSDLMRPFDYDKLNNLYDLFVPQREKSYEQRYFSKRSRMSHTPVNNGNSKETFNKQTTLLEKRMDESIPWDQKCKSSKELFKIKRSVGKIFNGVKHEVTNLQCDYLELLEKCECLEKELSKIQMMSKSFEALQKHAINLEIDLQRSVIPTTSVSRPQLKSIPIEDRVMLNNSQGKKQEVEDHRRNVKFSKNKTSRTACNDNLNAKTLNVNFVCATCGKCVLNEKHDMCVLKSHNDVNSRTTMPFVVPVSTREPKRTVKQSVAKPIRKTVASEPNQKPRNTTRKLYERIKIILFIVDSGYSKHMTGNLKLLINFVEKFLGTVKFGNDQIAPILDYGDLVQGAVMIKQGNDLLTGSSGTYLYSITIQDTTSPNPICLMAKVTSYQAWLWHHRLSHLNFNTINLLSKNDIVVGLPKLKFIKDHLCSSCELGKAKRNSDPVPKCQRMALEHDSLSPDLQCQENVTQADRIVTTSNELDLLFSLMFPELLNGSTKVVSKSSAVTTADTPNQRQQQNTTPLNTQTTIAPTYHPLEQGIGNSSQSVRTRRQLESDGEMCMFVLTVSQTEPKNIKEAMADSAWIKSMQEELRQFDRLDVWELVDRPLCQNVINMKWLWKNKRDEENTLIRNKSRLMAKGYAQKEGVDL